METSRGASERRMQEDDDQSDCLLLEEGAELHDPSDAAADLTWGSEPNFNLNLNLSPRQPRDAGENRKQNGGSTSCVAGKGGKLQTSVVIGKSKSSNALMPSSTDRDEATKRSRIPSLSRRVEGGGNRGRTLESPNSKHGTALSPRAHTHQGGSASKISGGRGVLSLGAQTNTPTLDPLNSKPNTPNSLLLTERHQAEQVQQQCSESGNKLGTVSGSPSNLGLVNNSDSKLGPGNCSDFKLAPVSGSDSKKEPQNGSDSKVVSLSASDSQVVPVSASDFKLVPVSGSDSKLEPVSGSGSKVGLVSGSGSKVARVQKLNGGSNVSGSLSTSSPKCKTTVAVTMKGTKSSDNSTGVVTTESRYVSRSHNSAKTTTTLGLTNNPVTKSTAATVTVSEVKVPTRTESKMAATPEGGAGGPAVSHGDEDCRRGNGRHHGNAGRSPGERKPHGAPSPGHPQPGEGNVNAPSSAATPGREEENGKREERYNERTIALPPLTFSPSPLSLPSPLSPPRCHSVSESSRELREACSTAKPSQGLRPGAELRREVGVQAEVELCDRSVSTSPSLLLTPTNGTTSPWLSSALIGSSSCLSGISDVNHPLTTLPLCCVPVGQSPFQHVCQIDLELSEAPALARGWVDLGRGEVRREVGGAPPEQAVAEMVWDAQGMTWEVYGAAADPEALGSAIQSHLQSRIRDQERRIRSLRQSVCSMTTVTAATEPEGQRRGDRKRRGRRRKRMFSGCCRKAPLVAD